MTDLTIGFIGLGNVGGQLAGNLLRHGANLTVRDLDPERVAALVARGAGAASCPRELAERVDLVITCLPSPAVSAAVTWSSDTPARSSSRRALCRHPPVLTVTPDTSLTGVLDDLCHVEDLDRGSAPGLRAVVERKPPFKDRMNEVSRSRVFAQE